MKLAILIGVAVLIVGGAAASYYHYWWWRDHRYDEMIVEAANRHHIDPALVKALVKVQSDFGFSATTEDEGTITARGLMLVPNHVADSYLAWHGREKWGHICIHRHFPNHDPDKPEQFTSDKEGTCEAPGCGRPLVPELIDPETNLEVGCWFLSQFRETLRAAEPHKSPPELSIWSLIAFRFGVPEKTDELTLEQRAFIVAVHNAYDKYRPSFEKRTRRTPRRHLVPTFTPTR
jgi:hypothetical protein